MSDIPSMMTAPSSRHALRVFCPQQGKVPPVLLFLFFWSWRVCFPSHPVPNPWQSEDLNSQIANCKKPKTQPSLEVDVAGAGGSPWGLWVCFCIAQRFQVFPGKASGRWGGAGKAPGRAPAVVIPSHSPCPGDTGHTWPELVASPLPSCWGRSCGAAWGEQGGLPQTPNPSPVLGRADGLLD